MDLNNIVNTILDNFLQQSTNNIFEKLSELYPNHEEDFVDQLTHEIFLEATINKPVRVSLSNEQINRLINEKVKISELGDTCPTCLEDFVLDEEVIRLPCKHQYHGDCIIPWLKRSVYCPKCHDDIREH
jgi:hypothetical protein